MRLTNRYIKLMALFFGAIVVKGFLVSWRPEWSHVLSIVQPCVILLLGILILAELRRDLIPSAVERADRETKDQEERARHEQARYQVALEMARDQERRERRNARQRERRAEKRGQEMAAKAALEERRRKAKEKPVQEPKSRWDRLLDEDE